MVSDIEYEHILTLDMRSRTKFDIQAHQLCGVPEHETLKAWCDWVKRATSETSYFAFDISALHTKVILHTRRIRVDPRIITLTAAVAALRIDINGDLRVWSPGRPNIGYTTYRQIFEQILSTWLPPFFLPPLLPSAMQARIVQRYVQGAIPSNAQCDALSDAPRIVRMLACMTEREHASYMLT